MEKKWYDNAVMINRDACWAWFRAEYNSAEECRKYYEDYFSIYDGATTDILLGVFEQTALVPNSHITWRGEKYDWKTEGGVPVDYKNHEGVYKIRRCYTEYKVDPVQIFINEVNKLGKRPWFTIRMNDAHYWGDRKSSFLRSSVFYEERDAGHLLGEDYIYTPTLFDFKYPEYKKALLGYIGELLEKYDVFGLDLDFQREIFCFKYLTEPDCHNIMTEYIREIRKVTNAAGKKWGHDIKLSIRTNRSPEDALVFGFDIKTMVDEGLVDLVVPSPHCHSDSGIPIRKWRELLGDKVGIIGGIEATNISPTFQFPKYSRAYAAAFYAAGADGIYFNNHEYGYDWQHSAWKINKETATVGHREFVVTSQDNFPFSERYKPLPVVVDCFAKILLEIGKVKANDRVKVLIDYSGNLIPTLCIGDKEFVSEKAEPLVVKGKGGDVSVTPNTPLIYDVSGISTDGPITLVFKGEGTIGYINIMIDAE